MYLWPLLKIVHNPVLFNVVLYKPKGDTPMRHFIRSSYPLYRLREPVDNKLLLRAIQPIFTYGTLYVSVGVLSSEGYAPDTIQLEAVLWRQPLQERSLRIATRFGEYYIAINPGYLNEVRKMLPVYAPAVW